MYNCILLIFFKILGIFEVKLLVYNVCRNNIYVKFYYREEKGNR